MNKKLYFLFVFLLISELSFSQAQKLFIVINEATWCPYCKANGQRVRKTVDAYSSKNKDVTVIHNDVTNEATRKKWLTEFKKLGIYEYMYSHKDAAMVYVFNAETKKNLDGFTITSKDEEIVAKLDKNLKKVM